MHRKLQNVYSRIIRDVCWSDAPLSEGTGRFSRSTCPSVARLSIAIVTDRRCWPRLKQPVMSPQGLVSGDVVELQGDSGSGKTEVRALRDAASAVDAAVLTPAASQLLLRMVATCVLPKAAGGLESRAVFFDCGTARRSSPLLLLERS